MSDSAAVHSADFFGPLRDRWWNADYLALLARRCGISVPVGVLDVGCGQGHWAQALAHVLPAGSTVLGIDREEESLAVARSRSAALRDLPVRFEYRTGDALRIDFEDESFDVVTCQTLLIHLENPRDALAEMFRVLKRGGLILCAEPNNLAGALSFDSTAWNADLGSLLAAAELQLRCERGKAHLGEGFNSAGELLPGWLADMKVDSMNVYLSDKAQSVWPPYDTPEMQETIAAVREHRAEQRWIWDKDTTRRYWLAGDGDGARFESLWRELMTDLDRCIDDIAGGRWSAAGGALMYVVSARKPVSFPATGPPATRAAGAPTPRRAPSDSPPSDLPPRPGA